MKKMSPKDSLTQADYQRKYEKKMRDSGYKTFRIWIPDNDDIRNKIREAAKKIVSEYNNRYKPPDNSEDDDDFNFEE